MKLLYTWLASAFLFFNLGAQAQYTLAGTASLLSSNGTQKCFELNQMGWHAKGAVWSTNTISLANSFTVNATLYFGNGFNGGLGQGDGIAFVLQSSGNNVTGLDGGGIGYGGIAPSFVVEFDMFQNAEAFGYNNNDIVADHIGFMKNGDPNHATGALKPAVAIPGEVENGQFHPVTFQWDAVNKVFTVTAFGLVYTYSGDIVAQIFSNNPNVFWGLTGATGSVDNVNYQACINDIITTPPPPPPPAVCGQLRTQTPGGWGSKPSGNNPGKYLHTNFTGAFPAGVTIGDMAGKFYKFTNAQAITNFLPSGGTAAKIPSSAINPTNIKNVLAGHLLALSLSVGFDDYDPNFASSGVKIGDMIINFGPFNGWTVRAFLAEANKVIGGTSNAFTVQQVLSTASAINEAYVDGQGSSNVLKCPTMDAGPRLAPDRDGIYVTDEKPHSLRTYPNPTTGMFQVQFETQSQGRVQIEITGSNGNIVERRSANVNRGQNMRFDLSRQPAGIYLIRIITEEGVSTQKVIVQK